MPAEEPSTDSEIVAPVRIGLIADAEGVQRFGPALARAARITTETQRPGEERTGYAGAKGGKGSADPEGRTLNSEPSPPRLRVSVVDSSTAQVHLVGQAGMRQPEALPGIAWYDDARVMLAQAGLEALVVATAPRAALALEDLDGVRGLPLWRPPPLARNFAEAVELARRLAQRPAPCRISSWWETAGPMLAGLRAARADFKPLFSRIRVSAAGPPLPSWRASLADAPGGVLATDAYDLLEALLALRGLPERVTAGIGQVRRRPGETPRETEGLALALLRYEGGISALLEATWDIPPYQRLAEHHGAEASLALEPHRAAWYGAAGELLQECPLPADGCVGLELERFVHAVRHPRSNPDQAETIERHLAVLALVQAIYLSARTGQPESPRKFYEVQKWPEPKWSESAEVRACAAERRTVVAGGAAPGTGGLPGVPRPGGGERSLRVFSPSAPFGAARNLGRDRSIQGLAGASASAAPLATIVGPCGAASGGGRCPRYWRLGGRWSGACRAGSGR